MTSARVIRLFYGFQFFFSLLLWVPVFYEYQRRIGLTDSEIFSIQSIYYLAFCLLEIPTGFVADRWGHRRCMRLGAIVLTLANLLPVFAPGFDGFLWHFLGVALSRSLISGASSAYLYEYLRTSGDLALYKRAEGNARAYGLVGKVVCWAFVGAAMQWKLSLPYALTALASAVSVGFAFALPAFIGGASQVGDSVRKNLELTSVWRMLVGTPSLVFVMFQGISIFVLARICQVNLFQPILNEKSFDLASFGIIMSIITVFEACGSAYPGSRLEAWLGRGRARVSDLNVVFIVTVVMALSLSLVAVSGKAGVVIWLSIFSLAVGLVYPVQRHLLNEVIPDHRFRATILSVESIIDRAACAWVAAILGGFVAAGKTGLFLHLSAGISIAGVLVLLVVLRLGLVDRIVAITRQAEK